MDETQTPEPEKKGTRHRLNAEDVKAWNEMEAILGALQDQIIQLDFSISGHEDCPGFKGVRRFADGTVKRIQELLAYKKKKFAEERKRIVDRKAKLQAETDGVAELLG